MRHAIVYVPGSSQHLFDQSSQLVADRIARSLGAAGAGARAEAGAASARYRVGEPQAPFELADGIRLNKLSIEVSDGAAWTPAIDVFTLAYLDSFVRPIGSLPPIARGVRAAVLVVRHLPGAVAALLRAGTPKGTLDKLQAAFLGLIVLVSLTSLVYWLLIGLAGVLGIEKLVGTSPGADGMLAVAAVLVGGMTAGRYMLKDLVDALERSAIEFYAMIAFLSDGRRSAATPNAVNDAVRHVADQGYDRVDLLAFSLGCLVTADAIYPRYPQIPSAPVAIASWITIGYPYDLIASTFPGSLSGRRRGAIEPARWLNVVTSDDFLGSNFRGDDRPDDPESGRGIRLVDDTVIAPERNVFFFAPSRPTIPASVLDVLPLRRLRNHTLYWDEVDALAPTCFGDLVDRLGWSGTRTGTGTGTGTA